MCVRVSTTKLPPPSSSSLTYTNRHILSLDQELHATFDGQGFGTPYMCLLLLLLLLLLILLVQVVTQIATHNREDPRIARSGSFQINQSMQRKPHP